MLRLKMTKNPFMNIEKEFYELSSLTQNNTYFSTDSIQEVNETSVLYHIVN